MGAGGGSPRPAGKVGRELESESEFEGFEWELIT